MVGEKVVLVDRTTDPSFWTDFTFPLKVLKVDPTTGRYQVGVEKAWDKVRFVYAEEWELMSWEEYSATRTLMDGVGPPVVPEEVIQDLAQSMSNTKHNIISRLLTNKRK